MRQITARRIVGALLVACVATAVLTSNGAEVRACAMERLPPGKEASVKVNGRARTPDAPQRPGTFMRLARKWKKGDVVELSFLSKPVVSRWKDDSFAVMRGPLLYALKIDALEKIVSAASCPKAKKATDW